MHQDLDQDRRQGTEQGLLQKPGMDEESKTLVIPQLSTEYGTYGMEYLAGQCWVTCPVAPPCMCDPLQILTSGT